MRVMTYNIRHGLGNAKDGTVADIVDLERIASIVLDQRADVIGIQEVDRFWDRSGNVDQVAELARLTGFSATFGPNLVLPSKVERDPDQEYGVMLMSRFPVLTTSHFLLPASAGYEPRGLLELTIETPESGIVAFFNTHLEVGHSDEPQESRRIRMVQVEAIAERVRSTGLPTVLMGDFNCEPCDPELELFFESCRLRDAWAISNVPESGFTIPASPEDEPERRIDLIMTSTEIDVLRSEVIVNQETRLASDHFPVVADIRF